MKIKKIKKVSFAKLIAWFYGSIFFLVGVSFTIASVVDFVLRYGFEAEGILKSLGSGSLASLFLVLAGFFIGYVEGYVIAVFYNIFARRNGGLEIEVEE